MNKSDRGSLYPILANMLYANGSDRFQTDRAIEIIQSMKIDINDLEFEIKWVLWENFKDILLSELSNDIDEGWCLKQPDVSKNIINEAGLWISEHDEMLVDTFFIYTDLMDNIANDIIDDMEKIRKMVNHNTWARAAKLCSEENDIDTSDIVSPLIIHEGR